jgi:hypothetical protein
MKKIRALTILMTMTSTTLSSAAIECLDHPGSTARSYRIIDGRRCYFPGRTMLPKAELHWSYRQPPQRKEEPPPPSQSEPRITMLRIKTVPAILETEDVPFEVRWDALKNRDR